MTPVLLTPITAIDHDLLAQRMLRQLDKQNFWELAGQQQEVKVYVGKKIADGFDGFKTVTVHEVGAMPIVELLGQNLCTAMQMMNHLYHSGEVLRLFYNNAPDDYYAIVRTNFKMPFPLTNREFLHTIMAKRIDAQTVLIMYHSVHDNTLPPTKKGFLRCPTYLSGQRITALTPTCTQVEHLMVYALGGWVSKGVQNSLFKSGHVKAYLNEWQRLVNYFK